MGKRADATGQMDVVKGQETTTTEGGEATERAAGARPNSAGAFTSRTRGAAGREASACNEGRHDPRMESVAEDDRAAWRRARTTDASGAPRGSAPTTAKRGCPTRRSSGGGSRASCSLGACEFVKGPGLYPRNAPRDSQGGTMVHYDERLPPSQVGMNGAGWYAQGAQLRQGARRRGCRGTASSAGRCQASPSRRTVRDRGFWRPGPLW